MNADDDKKHWLDDSKSVGKLVKALVAVCVLLFIADAFYHKHSYFAVEDFLGFYAFLGFAICVVVVLAAKGLRVFLMRSEDYYDAE